MDLHINYNSELEKSVRQEIEYIKEEFELLFGHLDRFEPQHKRLAANLLNYLSKMIETPVCLDYLTQTLQILERKYSALF
jgi:hypothetical protein